MSIPISDVKNFIIQLIWGFKIHHYSHHVYITSILAYFDIYYSVKTLPHSRHYHSCLHEMHNYSLSFSTAHPCPSWMTAVSDRKMLLFYWSPVDGDIFILLYCYCCWRPITQGLSHTQEGWELEEKVMSLWVKVCCVSVCVCVCVSAYAEMFVSVAKCCVLWRAH